MEDAMAGVNAASGDVDFQTWLELKNTMDATNAAFEVGTALAKAREDAAVRTGETERTQIQKTKDADQTRWELYAAARADAAAKAAVPIVQQMVLDDSAIRKYRPPIIQIQGRIQLPAGSQQLIQ